MAENNFSFSSLLKPFKSLARPQTPQQSTIPKYRSLQPSGTTPMASTLSAMSGVRSPQSTPLPNMSTVNGPAVGTMPSFSTNRVTPRITPATATPAQPTPTAAPVVATPQATPTTFTTPSGAVVDASGDMVGGQPSTTGTAQTQGTTPTAPVIPPETQTAVQSAEKAMMEASKISPEEISTQADLDRLIESTKKAFQNTADQPIPLEFITGQLKSIENRALGLAEPLEAKLARLEAKRTSAIQTSKFALERADKKASEERASARDVSNDTYINEEGDVILYDTRTGKTISNLGKQYAEPTTDSFTLSPGQVRYDSQGNVIASGGVAPKSEAQQAKDIQEQEKATAAQTAILENLNLVNNLLTGDAYKAISGIVQTGSLPFTSGSLTKNQYNQLKSALSISAREKMKGSGAISDFEAKTLEQSTSALGRNLKEADMEKALKGIRGAFTTATGGEATVTVTDPKTGESIQSTANRDEINQLIREGNVVEYN